MANELNDAIDSAVLRAEMYGRADACLKQRRRLSELFEVIREGDISNYTSTLKVVATLQDELLKIVRGLDADIQEAATKSRAGITGACSA